MSRSSSLPIAIFHEHPDWFRPLFTELDRRKISYQRIDAASHSYDPLEIKPPYSLVFNRASPSAYLRGNRNALYYTLDWLRHLERLRVPVVNGSKVYGYELSKAAQARALAELGLPFPRTIIANSPTAVLNAAKNLRYPILVKANVGGSGAGIERYDTEEQLAQAAGVGRIDFGVDGIALVQELAPLRDGHITRIEVLGGRFLYAIDVFPADTSYNLCPADVCQTTDGVALDRSACAIDAPKNGLRVQAAHPSASIIAEVERIAAYVNLDIGGIELLIDDRDGKHYFYDVNALSNFVAQPEAVVGFNPWSRLVDYLQLRAGSTEGFPIPRGVDAQLTAGFGRSSLTTAGS